MSDKHLSEREWKAFSKDAAWKWEPLHKALVQLEREQDKAGKSGEHQPVLAVLDDVGRQVELLRKTGKGDKALAAQLARMDDAASALRKECQKARQDKAGDTEGEDESSNALLAPALTLKQLQMCKRDPERIVHFGFVNNKDQVETCFALSARTAGRKLFALLQAETGVKQGAYGDAWMVDDELILRPDKPVGGLVKVLRGFLRHVGFRVRKITLWNEDGTVMEQDDAGEAEEAEDAAAAPASVPADASSREVLARLKVLLERLGGLGDPARIDQIKALARDAGAAGRLGQWDEAGRLLGSAELLCSPAEGQPGIDFARCIADWEAARQIARQDLSILKSAILEHYRLSPDRAEVEARAPQLDHLLDGPYATLTQLLQKASELAKAGNDINKLRASLSKFSGDLRARTQSDRLLSSLARNPFQPIGTQRTLLDALGALNASFSDTPR